MYCDSVMPSTLQFDILGWWEGMRLPNLYNVAQGILAIPYISCDVERFWKRVRSEKHLSM